MKKYEWISFIWNTCNIYITFLIQDYKQPYQKPEKKPTKQPSIDNKYNSKQTKDSRKTADEPLTKKLVFRHN